MRILFDQATPVPLRSYLGGHSVSTAAPQRWDELRNGDLLKAAEDEGFEVLVTTDKNMQYQQNLSNRKIAVVVLGTGNSPLIEPYVQRVVAAVNSVHTGGFVEVDIPFA